MRRSLAIFALFGALIVARASATTVTGTVVDSDAVAWANGLITFTLVSGQSPSCSGVPMTQSQLSVTATLNGSGAFSATLCSNSLIAPVNSQWQIRISSSASAAPQNLAATTVSGSSQDLSTYINGLIAPIRVSAINQARAYADGEILSPVGGTTYYNTASGAIRLYNGVSWLTLATGSTGISTL